MNRIVASAPGKIVVCGDYAVLAGAPAVVMAVDRRAQVNWTSATHGGLQVRAPDVGVDRASARCTAEGIAWQPAAAASALKLVARVLEAAGRNADGHLPTGELLIDTASFFLAPGGAKLGLGSSAAVLVALAAWLAQVHATQRPSLADLIALHRQLQGGRGSGVDVATSLHGGLLAYRNREGMPTADPLDWPRGLVFACMWSGHSASTGSALDHLAAWRERHQADYQTHMGELGVLAQTVATGFGCGDVPVIMDGMSAYANALRRLGEASGIDIVTAQHRALIDLAHECGAVYKSCGAGGGDVGMALARDPEQLQQFLKHAARLGFARVALARDAHGLDLQWMHDEEGDAGGQRTGG